MSFSLNKLVQPECGASNPLVAAAQQIAMRPSTSASLVRQRQQQSAVNFTNEFILQQSKLEQSKQGPKGPLDHFVFHPPVTNAQSNLMYQNSQLPVTNNSRAADLSNTGKFAIDFLAEQELSKGIDKIRATDRSDQRSAIMPSSSIVDRSQTINHLMGMSKSMPQNFYSQNQSVQPSASEQLETKYRNDIISQSSGLHHDGGKLDDVQFWQSLSQKYIGPNTYDSIAAFKAESSTSKRTDQIEEAGVQVESVDQAESKEDFLDESFSQLKTSPDELEYHFDERNPLKDQYEDPFAEGLKRLGQGDVPSAALLFEAAVQKDHNNSLAWRYLGTTQAQNENDMSAIKALRNCLNLDPNDQEARLAISVSLANELYHNEACKHLLEWLIRHEKYRTIGASVEDFKQLDKELSDDPFYVNSIHDKHYRYVRDKFFEAARMSPTNPDPEVQSSLGVLFNMKGEYEKAVDCFKAALSVKSEDSVLWNRLGATLANGNKSDEAVIAYRKALEIAPGFLRSRYNLAISLIHLNTYDEAAKQLVQILNTQAAGKGSKHTQIRTRSITSTAIWNTLRTVATLMNRPDLYPIIEGRDLASCNEKLFKSNTSQN